MELTHVTIAEAIKHWPSWCNLIPTHQRVYRLVKQSEIQTRKQGRSLVFDQADLFHYLEELRRQEELQQDIRALIRAGALFLPIE